MPLPFRPRTRALVLAPILAIALIVVPAEALNIARWVAVAAAIAWLVVALLSKEEDKVSGTDGMQGQSETRRVRAPSTGAALVVGVDGTVQVDGALAAWCVWVDGRAVGRFRTRCSRRRPRGPSR